MKFEVGDVVRLTKSGWARSFRRDPAISTGALAIVKAISWDTELYACEFFPPAKSRWLHSCGGACSQSRGRWMNEEEIEPAALPVSANIAELFGEVHK